MAKMKRSKYSTAPYFKFKSRKLMITGIAHQNKYVVKAFNVLIFLEFFSLIR